MEKQWVLYIVECKDGSLYTGITNHLEHRLMQHATGKGAKYTRGRSPLTLVYTEACESHSHALKREYEVKSLSRDEKIHLCDGYTGNGAI